MTNNQPVTPEAPTWSEELRAFLERHGMTREAFAREAGVSWITVQRWCTTDAKPSQLAERAAREAMKRHERQGR